MAGYVAQALNTLSSPVTATAGTTTDIWEIDISNGYLGADLFVDIATNASATSGCEVYLVKKTDTTVNGGIEATTKYSPRSVNANSSAVLHFSLEAGVYQLKVKNNDATYDATVNQVILKPYVWA